MAKPAAAAIIRNGMIACRYRSSLCRTTESATNGTSTKDHRVALRPMTNSGSNVGAHQRAMFTTYQRRRLILDARGEVRLDERQISELLNAAEWLAPCNPVVQTDGDDDRYQRPRDDAPRVSTRDQQQRQKKDDLAEAIREGQTGKRAGSAWITRHQQRSRDHARGGQRSGIDRATEA